MRVEVFDESGNRYTITFQGRVTRDKALRLLDVVELLGGMPGLNPGVGDSPLVMSKFDEVRLIVARSFPIVWFSSHDVQTAYEQELKKPISLSTVSTYLSRMTERGFLANRRMSNRRSYRLVTRISQNALRLAKGDQ